MIIGVVTEDGEKVDINWGSQYWNHAFSEVNRVLGEPYSLGSVIPTGGSYTYEFRNQGGHGGRDNDGIWINPASSRSDISRRRTGVEELAETAGFNNLYDMPSSATLCDSNKSDINSTGQKALRMIYLLTE